jgi:hypothetical protein
MAGRLIGVLGLAASIGTWGATALAESIVDTGVIEGVVRDASGLPIQDVEIALAGHSAHAAQGTNFEGRFELRVSAGEWDLRAERNGYEGYLARRIEVKPGTLHRFTITLYPD